MCGPAEQCLACMATLTSTSTIILWVYILLLLIGGTIGFLKAGSKISLIASAVFALPLALCAAKTVPFCPLAPILLILLIVVFGIRFWKGRKFMPSGLMVILTIAAVVALIFTVQHH